MHPGPVFVGSTIEIGQQQNSGAVGREADGPPLPPELQRNHCSVLVMRGLENMPSSEKRRASIHKASGGTRSRSSVYWHCRLDERRPESPPPPLPPAPAAPPPLPTFANDAVLRPASRLAALVTAGGMPFGGCRVETDRWPSRDHQPVPPLALASAAKPAPTSRDGSEQASSAATTSAWSTPARHRHLEWGRAGRPAAGRRA